MLQFKEIITYIFIIGAAQGLLLTVFLFRKKENKIANRLLAVTMLFFAIDLILEAAAVTGEIKKYPFLIGLMQAFPYVYGPAIYLYVFFITRGIKKFNYKYLLHYLPFILVQIYYLFFFYLEPPSYQINLVYVGSNLPWHVLVVSYITPIYGGLYLVLTAYKGYQFNKELKNKFSSIDKHNLSWVTFIIVGSILLWIVAIFMTTLQLIYGAEIRPELVSYLAISVFIYAMAYKGLKQPEVVFVVADEQSADRKTEKDTSYKKSGLSEEYASDIVEKLNKVMENAKPYLKNDLNLSELASMVNVSTHNLSEIINTKLNQNFYDFINKFRVDEVKRLIEKDEKKVYSILALGFEAGFSSKSAFYSAFKKAASITPAQYRSNTRKEKLV